MSVVFYRGPATIVYGDGRELNMDVVLERTSEPLDRGDGELVPLRSWGGYGTYFEAWDPDASGDATLRLPGGGSAAIVITGSSAALGEGSTLTIAGSGVPPGDITQLS